MDTHPNLTMTVLINLVLVNLYLGHPYYYLGHPINFCMGVLDRDVCMGVLDRALDRDVQDRGDFTYGCLG